MDDRSAPNRTRHHLQDLTLTFPPPPPPQVQPTNPDFSYNFTHFQNGLNLNETTFVEASSDDVWKDMPSDFYPHLGMAVDPTVQMSQWMQGSSFGFPVSRGSDGSEKRGGVYNPKEDHCVVDELVERRQLRMIKNRESAARSRARKQAYTNQLEQKAMRLRKTITWLKKQKEVSQLLFSSPKNAESRYQLRRTSSANF